jgi:uncharacterized protein YndB with AHSA1/START domain
MTDSNDPQDWLVIERTFDAPVGLIWQMWTDPHHFKMWYGPDGATIPAAEMDVRVGGRRLVCIEMRSPDGPMRMWFTGEYREVVENERLVYTDAMSDEQGNMSSPSAEGGGHPTVTEVRVELQKVEAGTRIVLTHVGVRSDSPGAAGWMRAFAKLDAHLANHADR